MLVDAHAHPDRYGAQLAEAIEQIQRHRILTIAVAMDPPSYRVGQALARRCPYIRPVFGVHPWEAPRYADDLVLLDEHLAETPMIGEAGLDFRFVEDADAHDCQRRVFDHQCEWAARLDKPMNLHSAGAEREVLETLRWHDLTGCIIHWYSGPAALIDDYLALGCLFTIGVEVIVSKRVQQIARLIPLDRLLLETDNPGAWDWLEGSPGMPVLLLDVLEKVAGLRGVDVEELERRLEENWRAVERRVPVWSRRPRTV